MREEGRRSSSVDIRSYRTVFELERRVYRIDRLRLPPGGIPMRGAVYGIALVLAIALGSTLPLVRVVASTVPWYVRDVAVPVALAALLTIVRLEGRPFHVAVRALMRHRLGPRWLRGLRPASPPGTLWWPGELLMLPDGSDGSWRAFAFSGPGAVLVNGPHECRGRRGGPFAALVRRPHVTLRELPGDRRPRRRRVVALSSGARLRVRPAADRRRRPFFGRVK